MDLTVGILAKKFGLSRSTLLYYDSIGLLSPSGHQRGEYRIYGGKEVKRLELICRYRKIGLSLKEIKKILDIPETDFTSILNARFEELSRDIYRLQEQQKIIAGLMQNSSLLLKSKGMNKQLWSSILKASGFSDVEMRNWHITFEREAPEQHLAFLQYLQIPKGEIDSIRTWTAES